MDSIRWFTILGSLSFLFHLACRVAILAAVMVIVRRHRPDAYKPMVTWAAVALAASIALWLWNVVATPLLTLLLPGVGVVAPHALYTVLSLLFEVALTVLLVRGLVALAQPPKPVVAASNVPFR
jgi:hypothetical protein